MQELTPAVLQSERVRSEAEKFIIAEFETQRDMRASLNTLVATETQLYVGVVAATFVGLSLVGTWLVGDNKVRGADAIWWISWGILLVNVVLGIGIFIRIEESRVTVNRYVRNMNRTRRYFVDTYPQIDLYVSDDIFDDEPQMGSFGNHRYSLSAFLGVEGLVSVLTSTCVAALTATALVWRSARGTSSEGIQWGEILNWVIIAYTIIAFLFCQFSAVAWQQRVYWLAENGQNRWRPNFPRSAGRQQRPGN